MTSLKSAWPGRSLHSGGILTLQPSSLSVKGTGWALLLSSSGYCRLSLELHACWARAQSLDCAPCQDLCKGTCTWSPNPHNVWLTVFWMALASLILHTLSFSNLKAHSWGCFGNGSSGAGAMSLKGLVSLDACWYPSIRRWNLDATEVDHRQSEARPECGPDYSVPRVRPQSWEIVFFFLSCTPHPFIPSLFSVNSADLECVFPWFHIFRHGFHTELPCSVAVSCGLGSHAAPSPQVLTAQSE